ncbi:hypothetical protein [Actinoallomurus acaciae]|uniref:Uncharacterized protein n=1 Tax=Actinoallomurus acaciae TaxID=502577 RepID=A0ABV5YEI0_9ACTN
MSSPAWKWPSSDLLVGLPHAATASCAACTSAECSRRCGTSSVVRVIGAEKRRNSDDDLPRDFEASCVENYGKFRRPLDPKRFTAELAEEMDAELSALNDALGQGLGLVEDLRPQERRDSKAAIRARWGSR